MADEAPPRPRVLLVYGNPAITATPVTPYGMERVAQVFELAGCAAEMIAPWIEADPLAALDAALARGGPPALVGFSVRNLDDALVVRSAQGPGDIDTTFYLDDVRPLVARAIAAVGRDRVLVGGTALAAGDTAVLHHLGASRGIAGPAEDLVFHLGRCLALGRGPELPDDVRVVIAGEPPARHAPDPRLRGFADAWRPPPGATPRMGPYLGLVLARGGRVPVQISAGCDRRCHFCVEARFLGHRVVPRPVEAVVAEIRLLRGFGLRRFWLAGSELNVPDERHAIALLRALSELDVDVSGFIQVAPVSDALLDALEDAGVDPTELSFELGHLDDAVLRAGGGPANRRQVDRLVETWLRRGYRQLGGSVLFGAHPAETDRTLRSALDAAVQIDAALPDGFGLAYSCGARVYPRSDLADWLAADWHSARKELYTRILADGSVDPVDPCFVRPVVFCRPGPPRVLLARVQDALSGVCGRMGPMNAEAPTGVERLAAEAAVNRGIWRLQEDAPIEAAEAFELALGHAPDHLEALAQLSQVWANHLGEPDRARDTLSRLHAALGPADPRLGEVEAALAKLSVPKGSPAET